MIESPYNQQQPTVPPTPSPPRGLATLTWMGSGQDSRNLGGHAPWGVAEDPWKLVETGINMDLVVVICYFLELFL